MSLPRGSCPHGGGLVLTTAVCRTCERSMVVDAVMAVAAGATHAVVAEVVAEVTEGPAALRSIRQALTGGPGALLVGAPPAVGGSSLPCASAESICPNRSVRVVDGEVSS